MSLPVCWQAGQGRRPFSGITVGSRDTPGSKPGTAQSHNTDSMQLVAAEYVLDFGYVIKGTQKVGSTPLLLSIALSFSNPLSWRRVRQTYDVLHVQATRSLHEQDTRLSLPLRCPVHAQVRKFKAVNTGCLGVTFAMDTKAMEKYGFTVTPDKMPLLAGAPVHGSLELTVTLQVGLSSSLLLLLL